MLYQEDCLTVLKKMPDAAIDMVYLDPPFYSQKKQVLRDASGKKYEFPDIWQTRRDYLEYMGVRLEQMQRILKPTGSIFLHCDSSASHYLRILLDSLFGEKNFRSEIIWSYKRWSNSSRGLLPAHQTILFYSKTNQFKFHTIYTDYSPTTNLDQILQERERNEIGKAGYKHDQQGNIVVSKEKRGVPLSDIWEIPFLNPKAKERTGYPTQKPIELLERIIKISTDKGDCILDPFCGSGTALVAAKLLERDYIGVDTNPEAVLLCQQRLETLYKTTSNLLKVGVEPYKTKSEEELSILRQFSCHIVQRNKGIDAFMKQYYLNAPVAIRIQRKNESFMDAVQMLHTAGVKKKCSFTILITYEPQWELNYHLIPSNMIVITQYEAQAEYIIQNRILKKAL